MRRDVRGERRGSKVLSVLNTRHLLFLEATYQAKLKILHVIAVRFSKTHSQLSERDVLALSVLIQRLAHLWD